MVIDFHVHGFPDELAARAVPSLEKACGIPARLNGTITHIKESMRKAGIDRSLVLSIATKPSQTEKVNDWSAGIQDDEIIAFGSIHPENKGWKKEVNRLKGMGIKGIKLHPEYQEFYIDTKSMYDFYEYVFGMGLIIVFHAGVDLGLSPPYHCTPDRLLKLIRDFPEGKLVAAHMGGYEYWDEVEEKLIGTPLYLDTSMSIGRTSETRIRRMIDNHDPERILFATDSPWSDQLEELERLKLLMLDKKTEELLLGKNASKLLGI